MATKHDVQKLLKQRFPGAILEDRNSPDEHDIDLQAPEGYFWIDDDVIYKLFINHPWEMKRAQFWQRVLDWLTYAETRPRHGERYRRTL